MDQGPAPRRAAAGVVDSPTPRVSLVPSLQRIAEMTELPPNWDSYGGVPPTARAVAEACLLIEAVAEAHERIAGVRQAPWTSAPIADGGLHIEWLGDRCRIEVQVSPSGELGYLLVREGDADAEYHEADGVPRETAAEVVLDVLAAR